jgi:hypothetical protein
MRHVTRDDSPSLSRFWPCLQSVASSQVTVLAKAMGYLTPEDAASDKTYLPYGASELHHNHFPRQLWGTAVDISADGTYVEDPSHAAFYLPGQEFGTGNHRAFAALDPCRKDSDSCTSGIDCCGGFCYVETHLETSSTSPKARARPR